MRNALFSLGLLVSALLSPAYAEESAPFSMDVAWARTKNIKYYAAFSEIKLLPCYQAARQENPELSKAIIVFNVEVRSDGTLALLESVHRENMTAELEACTQRLLESGSYPTASSSVTLSVVVVYQHFTQADLDALQKQE